MSIKHINHYNDCNTTNIAIADAKFYTIYVLGKFCWEKFGVLTPTKPLGQGNIWQMDKDLARRQYRNNIILVANYMHT